MQSVSLTRILASLLVIVIGLVTLFGVLVGDDLGLLSTLVTAFPVRVMADVFVRLAVITVTVSILAGVLNLLFVHATRITREPGLLKKINSIVVIVTFILTLVAVIVDRAAGTTTSDIILNDVQVAIEASLAGLIFFALVYGAFRLLRNNVTLPRVLFLLAMLVVLIGALPLPALGWLHRFSDWLMRVPVDAGGRGILLGVALATVVTGVRVLFGQDRSYGE